MEFHEIANIFPLMADTELESLITDIKTNGLIEPICLYDGKILDGRNRYVACQRAEIEPRFTRYTKDNPLGFVISLNLKRRHLNESQRAVVASRLANMTQSEAGKIYGRGMDSLGKLAGAISQPEAAKMLNVSERTIRTIKAIEKVSPELLSEIEAGRATATKIYSLVKRDNQREEYEQRVAIASEKIKQEPGLLPNLILCDPPWRYDFAETKSRQIENQYDTLTVPEIGKSLKETEPDCLLLLWATAPKIREAFKLLDLWRFEYKTQAIWDKEIIGAGYWWRGQHEILIAATKGDVSPPLAEFRVSSVFRERRTIHSKKPLCVYEWIERAFADKIKLEMFCREPREGWLSWGNEC